MSAAEAVSAPDCEPVLLVAVDSAAPGFDRLYSYSARGTPAGTVRPGMRVAVPFGKGNRRRIGMVLKTENVSADADDGKVGGFMLKPVAALLETQRKPEVPASPRGEALFRCARPSGVPRGPATSTGSLASQRHPGKFPKVPGRRRGKRGFPAA